MVPENTLNGSTGDENEESPRGSQSGYMRWYCKVFEFLYGGARRDRTDDLNTASVALSQLSYGPTIEYSER